ncbi:MAG TPA: glycosyltransferase family 2 protein [Patescibacteria group bacterium]
MDISIIIPNYNGVDLLRKNLPKVIDCIKTYRSGKVELIIPDDASTDDSVTFLEEFAKKSKVACKVVANKKNKGFSGNVNSGVAKATGDILLLLNTDVIPHKGFLDPLVAHFEDNNVFAVACMDESVENGSIVLRGRGVGRWRRGFLLHSKGSVDKTATLWASGGSSAFRKTTWEKLGGLNELYNPFYWEDIDLSYRAKKAGFAVLFEPKSKVVHEHSKGAIKTQNTTEKITKIAYRNQFYFVWLNVTDPTLIFSHFFWLPMHLLRALTRGNTELLGGFFEALLHLPQVLIARAKNLTLFNCSDKDVINSVQ